METIDLKLFENNIYNQEKDEWKLIVIKYLNYKFEYNIFIKV
jgi:hypothetical protein